jgi:hypothetical protein
VHPKVRGFVPCTFPPLEARRTTRAEREREAKAYWDSLTPEREGRVLRKMRFASFGSVTRDYSS